MRFKARTTRQNRLKMAGACKLSTFVLVNADDSSDFIEDSGGFSTS